MAVSDRPGDDATPRRCVVIKVGGDVLLDDDERRGLADNVRDLVERDYAVVLLHGGGPQVSRLQERLGITPNKVGGRRITSPEDLVVVEQAICGEVNVQLCAALLEGGVAAFGCHGASGRLIRARKRPPRVVSGAGEEPVDFGEVGDVDSIGTGVLHTLLAAGLVPVIATLGVTSAGGRVFNINADTTSVRLAQSLDAAALLLVTKVGGIFRDLDDPDSRIADVTADEARALISDGVISGGMIPKVEEALAVLGDGVDSIAVVGAAQAGAFARVIAGEGDHGTRIRG
jgi:acetylglutamate kinase